MASSTSQTIPPPASSGLTPTPTHEGLQVATRFALDCCQEARYFYSAVSLWRLWKEDPLAGSQFISLRLRKMFRLWRISYLVWNGDFSDSITATRTCLGPVEGWACQHENAHEAAIAMVWEILKDWIAWPGVSEWLDKTIPTDPEPSRGVDGSEDDFLTARHSVPSDVLEQLESLRDDLTERVTSIPFPDDLWAHIKWEGVQAREKLDRTRESAALPQSHRRMNVSDANREAMRLANQRGASFFLLPDTKQAKEIGCHLRTWRKTKFYSESQKKKSRMLRQLSEGTGSGSLSACSLTDRLLEVTGQGNRDEVLRRLESDETLRRLTAEVLDEYEPSPLQEYSSNLPTTADD